MALLQIQGVEIQKTTGETEVSAARGGAKTKVPAGSYVVRMDQPYSRMADMLLDTQFYNINDPPPYDDTGWTLGALHNVKTIRVTDPSILNASMKPVIGPRSSTARSAAVLPPSRTSSITTPTTRFSPCAID